ncbi:MAG: hypothetical protein NZ699_17255 [Roseiflexus sp.]|nr:hypothetical protein [Roseiflexus sp.]MDW8146302.1 hypothetical protein [Roseiflexaceae bacterium]
MTDHPSPERTPDRNALAYPSFAALRAAHTDLLRRQRDEGLTPSVLGQAAEVIARGSATGVLLEDEDERSAAQSLLDYWATILIRTGYEPPDATLDEFDPSLAPELDDAHCPYVGLDPFREEDAARFFGRQRLVEFLVNRLNNQRMLALLGPSGAGKSSVVRAGLIPALKQNALPGSGAWRYAPVVTPGEQPLMHLARALRRLNGQPDDLARDEELAKRFRDPREVATAFDGPEPTVLVVDQLEELFTLTDDETERHAFVEAMVALVERPSPRHVVIATMRSDFESFIALEPSLQQWMERARVQLLPLSASEMREAIERPAELVGLKFEPGVVDALLHDTLGEPAALPLLQFSLLKLWDARDRNRVTWQAYQRIGGGRRALAHSADAFYNSLIPEDQVTARRILMRMVRPGEGLEITSNRIRSDQLYRAGEARDRVDRVLDRLIAARLVRLTPGDTPESAQIEIAHEALVRNWPTLVEWLEDERAAIATRRRLEAKAAEWVRLGGGAAGLLDEVQLAEAERWLNSAEAAYLGYDEALLDLVAASRAAIDQARRAEEEQRRRELEQAQALAEARRIQAEQNEQLAIEQGKRAEAEARSARRLRLVVITMAFALIGAIISGVMLILQQTRLRATASELAIQVGISNMALATAQAAAEDARIAAATAQSAESLALLRGTEAALAAVQEAQARRTAEALASILEREARQARAGQLAALAQAEREDRPILSLLLAIEAVQVTLQKGEASIPVADAALRGSLARTGGVGLAIGSPLVAAAASDDGTVAAFLTADGALQVWNLTDLSQPPRSASAPGSPTLLALSSDGVRLVTAGADPASIRLWDIAGATLTARELAAPGGINTAIALSRDGRLLAIGDNQGTTLVHDLTNLSAPPQRLSGLGGRSGVRALAFSPDGRILATGNDDSQARLYNLDSGSGTYTRERTRGALTSITFSSNGRWLAYGSTGGQVRLWRLNGAQFNAVYVLLGLTAEVTEVRIASGDALVIAGSADGTTCLWDLEARTDNRARAVLRGQSARITGLALNGGASLLATASADGQAALWDLRAADPGVKPVILRGHDGTVTSVVIPVNTSLMLTAGADGMARIWNLDAPLYVPETLPQASQELIDVACRAAGRTLSVAEWNTYFEGMPYNPSCQ